MLKAARHWGKFAVVWTVVSLVVLDSAWACRWRRRAAAYCAPACCDPCEVICDGSAMESAGGPMPDMTPLKPATPGPSDAPAAPMPLEPISPAPMPIPSSIPSPMATPLPAPAIPAASVEPPPPTPSAAPAANPAPPALSPEEDDPFAPAPAPKPAVSRPAAPATRPAAPAARPAAPPAPAPEDNDPFAPQPPRPATSVLPAPAKPAADPTADPFKISTSTGQPIREWVDDTGLFRVRGRLIAIQGGKVRILKATGRTTTVPLARLSRADQRYVAESTP